MNDRRDQPTTAPRKWGDALRYAFAEAYRPLFAAGALHAVLSVAAWFGWVEARRLGGLNQVTWNAQPIWAHPHLMIWGTLTFFVFGFLGTALPRWVEAPRPGPTRTAAWLSLLLAGQVSLLAGLFSSPRWLVAAALLQSAAFAALIAFALRTLGRAALPRSAQPRVVVGALGLGALGLVLASAGMIASAPALATAGIEVGLRGYLLLLVAGVALRVVPFFTARALQRPYTPRPPQPLLIAALLVLIRSACAVAPAPAVVAAAADAGLALVIASELRIWRPGAALRNPMIAILYAGLGWLVLGLLASALAEAVPWLGPWLRRPSLHALGAGGIATLVVGIATRVTLGHGGRPIAADRWVLACFGAIQLAALARVTLPLLAAWLPRAPLYNHWSGLVWCVGFGIWLARLAGPLTREPGGRSQLEAAPSR